MHGTRGGPRQVQYSLSEAHACPAPSPTLPPPPFLDFAAAQSALAQALQTLALLGNDGAAAAAPMAPAIQPAMDLSNLAALLSLEASGAQLNAAAAAVRPQVRLLCRQQRGSSAGGWSRAYTSFLLCAAEGVPPFLTSVSTLRLHPACSPSPCTSLWAA